MTVRIRNVSLVNFHATNVRGPVVVRVSNRARTYSAVRGVFAGKLNLPRALHLGGNPEVGRKQTGNYISYFHRSI